MEKAVVTGGAGFIGSHLVDALLARGFSVTVVDDLSSGKKENLGAGVPCAVADIGDGEALARAFEGARFVFHVAAIPGVPISLRDPEGTHRVNVLGTKAVMDAAARAGVQRVVFSSSAAVYGDTAEIPTTEKAPAAPISPYGAHKLEAEGLVLGGGVEGVVLRYFNVFGPRQNPTSEYAAVIPLFLALMRAGKAPTINGDGEHTRDYAYVDDVVGANILAATTPEAVGQVFNVACGREVSLVQLVDALNAALGTKIQPLFGPERAGDIRRSCADISKARHALRFEPHISFDEGIRRLAQI